LRGSYNVAERWGWVVLFRFVVMRGREEMRILIQKRILEVEVEEKFIHNRMKDDEFEIIENKKQSLAL
jgi:hypothetical protein